MDEKTNSCSSEHENKTKPRSENGYMGNFVRQPKGGRVCVFGEGYIRPNIINMPEEETR